MKETAVTFASGLVGVVTEPAAASNGIGAVFLNAGFTHHVGPQRLYVQLARALAALGYTALRFDYSGIGDSPARAGAQSFAARALAEAKEGMDLLAQTRGLERFAPLGICWGADNALRVATADPRVVGAVAVDFYAVMSARYFVRFYWRRLANPRSWGNILRGRSAVWSRAAQLVRGRSRAATRDVESATADDLLPVRAPDDILADLDALIARGAHLLFAYATVGGSYDRYVRDFRKRMNELARTDRLRVAVFRDADHVFTSLASQRELISAVTGWARQLAASPART